MRLWLVIACVAIWRQTISFSIINHDKQLRVFKNKFQLSMSGFNQPGNVMTLSRFMTEATRNNPEHGDFESLMISIQIACKTIANAIARTGIVDLAGVDANADDKGKHMGLYDFSSYVLKNSLRFSGKVGVLSPTSEDENAVVIEESWNSRYVAVFDPLDGAMNIDVGISTGTIFGIYEQKVECCIDDVDETLSDDSKKRLVQQLTHQNLVAAGYCMYSATTIMVISIGTGVHAFTLDPTIGEFVLTQPNIHIPSRGRTYSFNEANEFKWPPALRRYVADVKRGQGEQKLSYTSRYIGSLVGDVHRTLLHGGVFGYPADSKRPKGKLRLLQECRPMAFLVEQAGGKASTGFMPIRDIVVESLADHVPLFLGSTEDVEEVERYLATDIDA